jgi:hypothetical protein
MTFNAIPVPGVAIHSYDAAADITPVVAAFRRAATDVGNRSFPDGGRSAPAVAERTLAGPVTDDVLRRIPTIVSAQHPVLLAEQKVA